MISSVNSYSPNNNRNVSFGSAVVARVVSRNIAKNGDVIYSTLSNKDDKIVGVYQSLARMINGGKAPNFIEKLAKAIPDFNPKDPSISSTIIGSRSETKRFLLTGRTVEEYKDVAQDAYRKNKNEEWFKDYVSAKITNNPRNRVRTRDGKEIGIDLIVEEKKGKRKLIDIDVTTRENLEISKKPEIKVAQDPISSLATFPQLPPPAKQATAKPKPQKMEQDTFDFFDSVPRTDRKPFWEH